MDLVVAVASDIKLFELKKYDENKRLDSNGCVCVLLFRFISEKIKKKQKTGKWFMLYISRWSLVKAKKNCKKKSA